jgi:hypothetical protein
MSKNKLLEEIRDSIELKKTLLTIEIQINRMSSSSEAEDSKQPSKIRKLTEENDSFHEECDFCAIYNNLPFEENSFDVIINFTEQLNYSQAKLVSYLFQFLKENGTFLTKDEILNGIDYYNLNSDIFTVLKN